MSKTIVIIQGHPDPQGGHLDHALAAAYRDAAQAAGHRVSVIDVATLDFPLLRSQADWNTGETPPAILDAQAQIKAADHLVIVYPLWLGSLPALLKGFLEQLFRPGFAIDPSAGAGMWKQRLQGKSARIIVTMGMPAPVYRWYFRAHSLKSLQRNVLRFCGIAPVRSTLIGMVENASPKRREGWMRTVRALGAAGR